MLPVSSGGLLCLNGMGLNGGLSPETEAVDTLANFDLVAIAEKRLENASAIQEGLKDYCDEVLPLRPQLTSGEVPQTFPVVIRNVSRDKLYEMMNAAGYGVVTLYHTMIDSISEQDFPLSHDLAKHIFNLPMHQDVNLDQIEPMLECLMACIAELRDDRSSV
jgi:dTDP-4-amino-4,6-dideoxygalactose transaminase